ncbi:DUF3322 domain-containing protein [Pseudomonas silvicola]|nr:DUF3322 domain-containing protein [Pseudomonas silvicola]
MTTWGKMPEQVIQHLSRMEWQHPARLRERLAGKRKFPIVYNLNPPTGTLALTDIKQFHAYLNAWRNWPWPALVTWVNRSFRELGECDIPVEVRIHTVQQLITVLGNDAIARSKAWEARLEPLLALDESLYPALLRHLAALERLTVEDARLLAAVIPQLQRGLGQGRYLRAIPLMGVDTKFVELNQALIVALLDQRHRQQVSEEGGLEAWLGCRPTPSNWLTVKPLCSTARVRLAGLGLLKLPLEQLLEYPLPAGNILVVENLQTGYELPELPDTIAVCGGGANTRWLRAPWLEGKRIGYWGDLDTWGFKLLADARRLQPHIHALLMDNATLARHRERGCAEPNPAQMPVSGLSTAERETFDSLHNGLLGIGRLEQERLSQDWVNQALREWAESPEM